MMGEYDGAVRFEAASDGLRELRISRWVISNQRELADSHNEIRGDGWEKIVRVQSFHARNRHSAR